MSLSTERSRQLTTRELAHFAEHGYVIARNVLDPALMVAAREALWSDPFPQLDRHDARTWIGPFAYAEADDGSVLDRYTWKYRGHNHAPLMQALVPHDPNVLAIAEQLLGTGRVQPPSGIRGFYCTMLEGDSPVRRHHAHIDSHPFHLTAIAYIDDVAPKGGGFQVWPGSHRDVYYACAKQYLPPSADHGTQARVTALLRDLSERPRVDCHGEAGDVVLAHHRLAHCAGHNRTTRLRQAVLCDFSRRDLERIEQSLPQADMWRDWAITGPNSN